MARLKIVIAPDKFRGSLSATQAADAMAQGVLRAEPSAEVVRVPMADGGEGTCQALVAMTGGKALTVTVTGPLGATVPAPLGLLGDGRTALFEMASASGLALLQPDQLDPARATTRGTGELLLAALDQGAQRILIGIGGSATNDGGAGLAQALGFRLIDTEGHELPPGGGPLNRLARIETDGADPRLSRVTIEVACDVQNPLCGPDGASAVYGPQKGADPNLVKTLDENLAHLARVISRDLNVSVADLPGAGAAGGLGAGLVAFANAKLRPGAVLVSDILQLDHHLAGTHLCLTGEGALDRSSAFGKVVAQVAALAQRQGARTFVLAGTLGQGAHDILEHGVDAYFSICPQPASLAEASSRAAEWLEQAAEQAVRAFLAGRGPRP